jgi:hypothetical protein
METCKEILLIYFGSTGIRSSTWQAKALPLSYTSSPKTQFFKKIALVYSNKEEHSTL